MPESPFGRDAREWRKERERSEQLRRPPPRPNGDGARLEDGYGELPGDFSARVGRSKDAPSPRPRIALERFDAIEFKSDEEWLVKGVLPRRGVGSLFGKPGAFKTFVALDIAFHVAAGWPWGGRRVTQAPAIYIAVEGAAGVRKRVAGVRKRHPEARGIEFFLAGATINLGTERGDLSALCVAIEGKNVRPGIIVVDTLAASLGAGDENAAGMTMFLANCQRLAERFGAFVLAVNHVGHSDERRERGHSSIAGNVDVRAVCERAAGLKTRVEFLKVKDGVDGFAFDLELEPVELGRDSDGEPVTTLIVCRVEPASDGPSAPASRVRKVPAAERLLVNTIGLAIAEAGVRVQPSADSPVIVAAPEPAVRFRYYARLAEQAEPGEDAQRLAERQRKAFRRSLAAAIKSMRVMAAMHSEERILWLP